MFSIYSFRRNPNEPKNPEVMFGVYLEIDKTNSKNENKWTISVGDKITENN
jgi:hypothetical protein